MEKIKSIGSVIAVVYVFIGFFSGVFFYGQSRVQCIEEHGWFKGFVVGCDVIEGNFGPTKPPGFVTSQLKGLVWPYYFFFASTEQKEGVDNEAGEYPFGLSVEEQLKAASNSIEMLDIAKVTARCSIVLNVNAEGIRRQDPDIYKRMIESSNELIALSRSMTLVHLMDKGDWLSDSSSIDTKEARHAVEVKVSELLAFYQAPFDTLIENIASGKTMAFNETAQELYRSDFETCVDISRTDYGLAPFEQMLEILPLPAS